MRRLAPIALGVALACGTTATSDPAPLDTFYKPSGLAVHAGKLVVASSNFDLRYGLEDGGSLISVDPAVPRSPGFAQRVGAVRVPSYTGELAVADAAACGTPGFTQSVAIVASRATTELFPVAIGADGSLACDGCGVPFDSSSFTDPLAVGVACTGGAGGFARAYVAHLRSFQARGWISEYDLASRTLRGSADVANGPVRGLAFDRERERLWMTAISSGGDSALRWVDLSGGCTFAATEGGCTLGELAARDLPIGLEFRSIALANAVAPLAGVRRAYVTGRLYDRPSAGTVGGRNTDYGGLLVVLDLSENAIGGVDARIVNEIPLGAGAADVRVLPPRAGKRDVVAALDATALTLYDDETGAVRVFGIAPTTGAPVLGHVPWGIAVDPAIAPGDAANPDGEARLYVASFEENHVTPIRVPLTTPATACMLSEAGTCADANAPPRRIQGGTP